MTVPLRHFLVALGFLVLGVLVGFGQVLEANPGLGRLAHLHLLLAGWICITIMGAMTQFVPVWSGVELHSRRLARLQLVLVVVGLAGFVASLLLGPIAGLPVFGAVMLLGFWAFVYNLGRTMIHIRSYDLTERHFLLALGFFLLLTVLGLLLAIDFTYSVFAATPVARSDVVAAHATVAVFGAVLTTIYGALYQLATMFTQTELHGLDHYLRPVESVGHPLGVVCLATGRITDVVVLARAGGVLVALAAIAFSVILLRRLLEMQIPTTPMHTRYGIVVPALGSWALMTLPAWVSEPTAQATRFGASGTGHLLLLGVIGFVLLGTLYHIIPFIVWVHRYSDDLGFEKVPMIDDLYEDRLAAADAALLVAGTGLLVAADLFGLPDTVLGVAGGLVGLGVLVFTANMLVVLRRHSPQSIGRILVGSLDPRTPKPAGETGTKE